MPVHRFRVGADGSLQEVFVESAADGFAEVVGEVRSPGLVEAVHALQAAGLATTPGYSSEINLRMRPWLKLFLVLCWRHLHAALLS